MQPALTTIHVEKEMMGKKAFQKLIGKINGNDIVSEKLSISTKLIERPSVRKIE